MERISYSDAKSQNASAYFTGNACPREHIAPRRVKNRSCTACNLEKHKDRYKRTPAKQKKAQRRAKEWRENNMQRYRANQKRWRENNPDRVAAMIAGWIEENPDAY